MLKVTLLFENLSEYFSENSKNFIVYLNDYLKISMAITQSHLEFHV